MDVEKGIAEARLVKQKHLEELKGYEHPDPQWLLDLKHQDEQVALEEATGKKMEIEETDQDNESVNEKEEPKAKPTNQLRQR